MSLAIASPIFCDRADALCCSALHRLVDQDIELSLHQGSSDTMQRYHPLSACILAYQPTSFAIAKTCPLCPLSLLTWYSALG